MAEQRLAKDTASLEAAGWSGAGIANGAELAIVDSSLVHTDLDRQADTTTGLSYFHVRDGKPTLGDETNGNLILEFDPAYTTRENFLWQTRGGQLRLEAATNVCTAAAFVAKGGTANLVSGTFGSIYVAGSQVVRIPAGVDINTALYCFGDAVVEISDKVGDSIPLIVCSEGARVVCRRELEVIELRQRATLFVDNATGSAATSVLVEGGRLIPLAGGMPTVEWWGGVIDLLQAQEALNFGTTDFDIKSTRLAVPAANSNVTVGTPAGLFPSVPLSKN